MEPTNSNSAQQKQLANNCLQISWRCAVVPLSVPLFSSFAASPSSSLSCSLFLYPPGLFGLFPNLLLLLATFCLYIHIFQSGHEYCCLRRLSNFRSAVLRLNGKSSNNNSNAIMTMHPPTTQNGCVLRRNVLMIFSYAAGNYFISPIWNYC